MRKISVPIHCYILFTSLGENTNVWDDFEDDGFAQHFMNAQTPVYSQASVKVIVVWTWCRVPTGQESGNFTFSQDFLKFKNGQEKVDVPYHNNFLFVSIKMQRHIHHHDVGMILPEFPFFVWCDFRYTVVNHIPTTTANKYWLYVLFGFPLFMIKKTKYCQQSYRH